MKMEKVYLTGICLFAFLKKTLRLCVCKLDEAGSKDLRRIKKKSYDWYKEVTEHNGENLLKITSKIE